MFTEDDLLPISGLQHLAFCERQCALIHTEQFWDDNRLTAEGRQLHERTHEVGSEWRDGMRVARRLWLRSLRLGLIGQADVVEFHGCPEASGCAMPGWTGRWQPFPVEYKRGKPKLNRCDEVQLCAQALCLEEMLTCAIPEGALFYGKTRRRSDVQLDSGLRHETERLAARFREIIESGITPAAEYGRHCRSCSLVDGCMPKLARGEGRASSYIADILAGDGEVGPT